LPHHLLLADSPDDDLLERHTFARRREEPLAALLRARDREAPRGSRGTSTRRASPFRDCRRGPAVRISVLFAWLMRPPARLR
jgi:hypothetical protein